jgi:hypothetical protein
LAEQRFGLDAVLSRYERQLTALVSQSDTR